MRERSWHLARACLRRYANALMVGNSATVVQDTLPADCAGQSPERSEKRP
jgi:hypothetical protein